MKEKILSLILSWAASAKRKNDDSYYFFEAYNTLRTEGYEFPYDVEHIDPELLDISVVRYMHGSLYMPNLFDLSGPRMDGFSSL